MPATDQEQKDLYKPGGGHDKLDNMSPSEKAESDQLLAAAADRKSLYQNRGNSKKEGGFWQRRKKSVVISVLLGALGLGGFGGWFVLQGPFQLVHFAQLLQQFHFTNNEDAQDSRMGRAIGWIRYPTSPEMRRLGPIQARNAGKLELRLEQRGYKLNYDAGFFNRVSSIDLPDDVDVKKLEAEGHRIETDPASGKRRMVLEGDDFGFRRSAIKSVVGDALQMGKVSSAITARNLIRKAGVKFSVYNKVLKVAEELEVKWRNRREKNVKSEIETGNSDVQQPRLTDAPEPEDPKPSENIDAKRSQVKSTIKKVALGVGITDIVCTVKALGSEAEALEHTTITLRLIRFGTRIIAAGNQIMSGNIKQIQEVGLDTKSLYDKGTPDLEKDDENYRPASSWANAKSIQAESGQEQTGPDIPDNARPDGSQNIASELTDPVPGFVCGKVARAIGDVFDLPGFFIGLFADATGVLDSFMEGLSRLLAKEAVEYNASGAILGNYANYGARHAANQQAIGMGGRELSALEVAELDTGARQERIQYANSKGIGYKYFDINNPNSVVAQSFASLQLPKVNQLISKPATLLANLANLPKQLFTKAQAAGEYSYGFNEYGFSQGELNHPALENPFAIEEQLFKDVIDKKITFQERLDQLNEDINMPCFGVTLKMDGGFTQEQAKPYDEIPTFCSEGAATASTSSTPTESSVTRLQQIVTNIKNGLFPPTRAQASVAQTPVTELALARMYVMDSMTMASVDCYLDDQSSLCDDFGIAEEVSAGSGASALSGDCATLGPKLIDYMNQGRIRPENVGHFTSDVTECKVQAGIMALLVQLVEQGNFTYQVGPLKSGHKKMSASGNISNHWYGLAVDISKFSKSPLNEIYKWLYDNKDTLNLDEGILDPVPAGTSTIDGGIDSGYSQETLDSHGGDNRHIHVSVKGPKTPPGGE